MRRVHFSAITRPSWLGRAARNRHRHAVEQASRRWRGGRCDDSTQVISRHAPLLTAITLLGTVASRLAFSCGSGPVPSLLVPELFPAELRGKGGSVAMLSHWG